MQILTQADLSNHNTLQLRSLAEKYVEVSSLAELQKILSDQTLRAIPLRILGGGSNLVLPNLVSGLVIKVCNKGKELLNEDDNFWFVKAQAGEIWDEFVQYTLQNGFWGLENLSLIPGLVGAAPIQNIGAYGVEVKDSLWEVTAIDLKTGDKKVFTNTDCRFAYRDSFFKQKGAGKYLIWDVTFRLPKKNKLHLEYGDIGKEIARRGLTPNPVNISEAVKHIRQSKLPDPKLIGNAGSFFKNPIVTAHQRNSLLSEFPDLVSFPYQQDFKLAAGWLIDRAGWKGKRLGPVGMYEKQALVLVNHGGADAKDVWALAQQVRLDVKNKFNVDIEPEPIKW